MTRLGRGWATLAALSVAATMLSATLAAQDTTMARRSLAAARLRDNEIGRYRTESVARQVAVQQSITLLNTRLRANTEQLQRALTTVSSGQPTREQSLDALAGAAPQLLGRIRGSEERYLADARAVNLRAADRVIVIERGLESLRLKANALHNTAVAFNAGFDLASVASPTSFSGFHGSIEMLKGMSGEKQRGAIDVLVGWLKNKVPGIPVVTSLAGVVLNAMVSPGDTKKTTDLKQAGERLLCIAAVSQTALEQMSAVRAASERLERLSSDVERRATTGGDAMRTAVSQGGSESFETFMRRTYGDLASDSSRRPLPYERIEPALLSVAVAARLEYDLSRSSADLAAALQSALAEPTPVKGCVEESRELKSRFEQMRPAVRNLTESLTALASAEDGIAVFVPALPGR